MSGGRRYQIQSTLGEGAFGAVYLARTVGTGLQREVAIKVLHKDRARDPMIVKRLRDEARLLALIRHRAIVRVDDLVELDGDWSVIMEYVEGCDVATLLRSGPLPPKIAVAIAEEVANALASAWEQPGPEGAPLKLIHRDIKPSNVRITPRGEVKVLDFGVARAEFTGRESGTTRTTFGTLTYMSAERFEGHDSPAGDVYALGVMLFEMLAGFPPGNVAAEADRQPPGRRYAKQWAELQATSSDLFELVRAMLAFDPQNRPGARNVARALEDLRPRLRGPRLEDWAATSLPPPSVSESTGERRTGTILVESVARAPRPRINPVPVAGAVLLLSLLVGAAALGGIAMLIAARSGREVPAPPVLAAPVATVAPQPTKVVEAPPTAPVQEAPAPTPPPKTTSKSVATNPKRTTSATPTVAAAASSATTPKATTPKATTPATPATTPEAAGTGRLDLIGDPVKVTVGGSANLAHLGPGTYTMTVEFDDGRAVEIGGVAIKAGETATWKCSKALHNCGKQR